MHTVHTVIKFFLFLLPVTLSASYCFFTPPADALIADPKALRPSVKIAFLCKTESLFPPSVNLATEQIEVGMSDYLKAVQARHETNRENHWRDLGPIKTKAGEARLTSIDTKTEWGAVRLLQMIFVHEKTAYIMTAGALKSDFSQYFKIFDTALRSFAIVPDLYTPLSTSQRATPLKTALEAVKASFAQACKEGSSADAAFAATPFQKETWEPFQQMVIRSYIDMGAYWQILFLQMAQEELLQQNEPPAKVKN